MNGFESSDDENQFANIPGTTWLDDSFEKDQQYSSRPSQAVNIHGKILQKEIDSDQDVDSEDEDEDRAQRKSNSNHKSNGIKKLQFPGKLKTTNLAPMQKLISNDPINIDKVSSPNGKSKNINKPNLLTSNQIKNKPSPKVSFEEGFTDWVKKDEYITPVK